MDTIAKMARKAALRHGRTKGGNGWAEEHASCVRAAHRGADSADGRNVRAYSLIRMIDAWEAYAEAHKADDDQDLGGIGNDGYVGPLWQEIGKALIGLLSGEIGRLDAGTMDKVIRQVFQDHGLDEDGNHATDLRDE